jgi:hypothetical protein
MAMASDLARNRTWHLASRPESDIRPENFEIRVTPRKLLVRVSADPGNQ